MQVRTLVLAAAWLFSGLVYADQQPQQQHQHRGPDMDRLALLLDLNDQQKSQVQQVLDEQHEQMRAAMEQEHASGQHPSRDEMRAKHEQLQKDTMDKLSSILDAQQLKKFQALAEHGPGGGWGHHHGDHDWGSQGDQTTQSQSPPPTQH
jgi:Spy/CpxP family protein refolding chaperone